MTELYTKRSSMIYTRNNNVEAHWHIESDILLVLVVMFFFVVQKRSKINVYSLFVFAEGYALGLKLESK